MRQDVKGAIYDIAEDQMGYVTTAQAAAVGVHPVLLVQLARRGRLERASRGVYRLVEFPVHPLAQYMQATLWPHGQRGVLSHETALALHELADSDPSKVHITVPAAFRVQRTVPSYLVVHRADLPAEDITRLEAMPITTPARTIRDCMAANVGPALISQAVGQARQSGAVDERTERQLLRELRGPAGKS